MGGRPRETGLGCHGVHFICSTIMLSHRLLYTLRFTALDLQTPPGVPMRCSSVRASRPK